MAKKPGKIEQQAAKSRMMMKRLKAGDSYKAASSKSEKSLEEHAHDANKSFMTKVTSLPEEQRPQGMVMGESVVRMLVDNGVDELESNQFVGDIMDRFPGNALSLMQGIVAGDLRYVSKDDYEAIKEDFPLMDIK